MTAEPGPVDRYLDDLFDRLAGTGAAGRRIIAEAEDHLQAAADRGEASGLSRVDAERRAVAAFGTPDAIAAELRAVQRPEAWLRPAFAGAWLAGGLGLLAIGASGLVAEVLGRAFGPEFVAADGPGVTYTAPAARNISACSPAPVAAPAPPRRITGARSSSSGSSSAFSACSRWALRIGAPAHGVRRRGLAAARGRGRRAVGRAVRGRRRRAHRHCR
jgi:hypothetical protein